MPWGVTYFDAMNPSSITVKEPMPFTFLSGGSDRLVAEWGVFVVQEPSPAMTNELYIQN